MRERQVCCVYTCGPSNAEGCACLPVLWASPHLQSHADGSERFTIAEHSYRSLEQVDISSLLGPIYARLPQTMGACEEQDDEPQAGTAANDGSGGGVNRRTRSCHLRRMLQLSEAVNYVVSKRMRLLVRM